MLGSAYPPHFGNARRSEIMKQFVTSKVISKINDETRENKWRKFSRLMQYLIHSNCTQILQTD